VQRVSKLVGVVVIRGSAESMFSKVVTGFAVIEVEKVIRTVAKASVR
jgi:hypothetical protein